MVSRVSMLCAAVVRKGVIWDMREVASGVSYEKVEVVGILEGFAGEIGLRGGQLEGENW